MLNFEENRTFYRIYFPTFGIFLKMALIFCFNLMHQLYNEHFKRRSTTFMWNIFLEFNVIVRLTLLLMKVKWIVRKISSFNEITHPDVALFIMDFLGFENMPWHSFQYSSRGFGVGVNCKVSFHLCYVRFFRLLFLFNFWNIICNCHCFGKYGGPKNIIFYFLLETKRVIKSSKLHFWHNSTKKLEDNIPSGLHVY